jgi:hypothetical protein
MAMRKVHAQGAKRGKWKSAQFSEVALFEFEQ